MSGCTAVPRWTTAPQPGVGEHQTRIPTDLLEALHGLANTLKVPLSSVLLTAHAKVLGALSGDREVCTGYAVGARPPLPLRMTLGPSSWREALLATARAESEVLPRKEAHGHDLAREFETVFALAASGDGEPAEGIVLQVAFVRLDGLVLRLRYRTDALDADCAARIAGYHLTALSLIAADPDAEHARQTLLSAEELRFQLHGLAGPRRKLPDAQAHELFEERARTHPDAIAAVHGRRHVTYGELNARANRLGRALLARGLAREGVVGVVTERNVTVGNLVGVDQPLFQIVDTAAMWAELDVPEGELARIAVGQAVVLVLDGLGERELAGTIAYVAPAIDEHTRTARARVPLENPDGLLRANQFGQARIAVSRARQVPASASASPRAERRYGSWAKRSLPTGLRVLRSKVRISSAPPVSSVITMRSSATAVATTRAPVGTSAVTSAGLPSLRKRR